MAWYRNTRVSIRGRTIYSYPREETWTKGCLFGRNSIWEFINFQRSVVENGARIIYDTVRTIPFKSLSKKALNDHKTLLSFRSFVNKTRKNHGSKRLVYGKLP